MCIHWLYTHVYIGEYVYIGLFWNKCVYIGYLYIGHIGLFWNKCVYIGVYIGFFLHKRGFAVICQNIKKYLNIYMYRSHLTWNIRLQHAATRCNTLQHAATRCNTTYVYIHRSLCDMNMYTRVSFDMNLHTYVSFDVKTSTWVSFDMKMYTCVSFEMNVCT